ncbi:unnamed protein product [Brassicogethes aeneus]|uniref:Transcription initiation factor IIA subunit 1 n=1 Tax=Brassicogethes aeneus TaxID=1431903 RepID=A0A9P0B4Z6_BRAAE|nr:unnamed protein product [Brassicogethes aeneus]
MSNTLCKSSVLKIYQDVMEDVISGVRDIFLEEGVDENVLQELKQLWDTKLIASRAVHNEEEKKKPEIVSSNGYPKQQQVVAPQQQHIIPQQMQVVQTKMVPIQITLPPQPGTDNGQRVLTIQVPHTALQDNQLQKVLTGPVITATMGLPANIACSVLQQHVNAAFASQQSVTIVNKSVIQTDGAQDDDEDIEIEFILPVPSKKIKEKKSKTPKKSKAVPKASTSKTLFQTDGPLDTSDDDDDASNDDDDDDLDDDKDEEDQEMEDEGGEEEPLNSEDDVTDDDPSDLFETDNIVVCQYDKIIRNRNKWKFYLKDGIMNLSGQDYVFQKANGDAEW